MNDRNPKARRYRSFRPVVRLWNAAAVIGRWGWTTVVSVLRGASLTFRAAVALTEHCMGECSCRAPANPASGGVLRTNDYTTALPCDVNRFFQGIRVETVEIRNVFSAESGLPSRSIPRVLLSIALMLPHVIP